MQKDAVFKDPYDFKFNKEVTTIFEDMVVRSPFLRRDAAHNLRIGQGLCHNGVDHSLFRHTVFQKEG